MCLLIDLFIRVICLLYTVLFATFSDLGPPIFGTSVHICSCVLLVSHAIVRNENVHEHTFIFYNFEMQHTMASQLFLIKIQVTFFSCCELCFF